MAADKTESKFWLKSKTMLFNLSLALAGIWGAIEASTENLRASISAQKFGLIMTGVGVIGALLRLVSTTKLHHKKAE